MIEIRNLTFGYAGNKQAVFEDLSLTLAENRVYGLLGKNGSGKSTLLYLMTGLLFPKMGEVLFDGEEVRKREPQVLGELYFVPDEFTLPGMTMRKYVETYAPFYPHFSHEVLEQCLEDFGLDDTVRLDRLSLGQRKKALISFAIATGVRLLLMDEPTNGLDIPSKSVFRKLVARYMGEGQTILISTHQVHDVNTLFDELVVIKDDGQVECRSLEEMAATTENIEELFVELTKSEGKESAV